MVKDFFPPEELEPAKREMEILVDNLAQKLYKAGKFKNEINHISFDIYFNFKG